MESASIENWATAQNPKLALLQKIKQQKNATADATLLSTTEKTVPEKTKHKSSNDQGAVTRSTQGKKKHGQPSKRTSDSATGGLPIFSGAFLDELEKSVKITRPLSSQRRPSGNLKEETLQSTANNKPSAGFEGVPSAISINDIKTYMANLCKPSSQVTHDQKIYYVDHRLLLIDNISPSLSRHLLTERHMYGSGISSRIAEKKADIYETAVLLLEEFRLCPNEKIRPLLLEFLKYFTNVLASKDIGMTTYVIEQSVKAGVFQPLLDLSTGWTTQEENSTPQSFPKEKCFPLDVTLQMDEHLKDIEDQLTGTWKPWTNPEDCAYILPILEKCLRSSVRFHGLHTGVVNELRVSDWTEAGVQPDGSEGQVRPLSIALADKFPGYIDKYKIYDDDCEDDIEVTTTRSKNRNNSASGGGNGLISFHRLFPTGHALVSLGMRRKKYLEKLEGISEAIGEVLDDSTTKDFGTLASYMPSTYCTSSGGEDDVNNSANHSDNISVSNNRNKQGKSTKNEVKVTIPKYTYPSKNMYIVMTEDLTFDSTNVENKLNVPKFLTQVDFLRAVMLKPKHINETYRGLKEGVNRGVETAYL